MPGDDKIRMTGCQTLNRAFARTRGGSPERTGGGPFWPRVRLVRHNIRAGNAFRQRVAQYLRSPNERCPIAEHQAGLSKMRLNSTSKRACTRKSTLAVTR